MGNDRPGPYGDIIADGDSGQDDRAASNPDIVPYGDRLRPFHAAVPLGRIGAVAGRVDTHARTDETIIADGHGGFVKYSEIEICEETPADADLLSVVAEKRLVHKDFIVGYMPKQPFQDREPLPCLGRPEGVVPVDDFLDFPKFLLQFLVNGRIDLSCQHLLFLCHIPILK